jgi:enediyne biosynthesis protein E4
MVMRGLGDCRFERANEAWGFDGGDAWSTAFAATWEARGDWPTLAVGTYIDRTRRSLSLGLLHRQLAAIAPKARALRRRLALIPQLCPLSMLFTDWNRSGTPSLRVSNDREYYKGGQEQMWHIPPAKRPPLHRGRGLEALRIWGMGIASRDLTSTAIRNIS